jgi:hypothetical protein
MVVECLMKITLERILEALSDGHSHVLRAVMEVARRLALLVWFGVGL